MSEYRIGRDIGKLNARLARIEAVIGMAQDDHEHHGREDDEHERGGGGMIHPVRESIGVLADARPVRWALEHAEHFPPMLQSTFRLPMHILSGGGLQYDMMPQSQTWPCSPEPLVFSVNWDGGGSDEFFRLSNQTFSITKWTNPNTGIVTANYAYSANLDASGRAKSSERFDEIGFMNFTVTVRNAQNAPLLSNTTRLWVACNDHTLFSAGTTFDPGLYDLIAGANWTTTGCRVQHC